MSAAENEIITNVVRLHNQFSVRPHRVEPRSGRELLAEARREVDRWHQRRQVRLNRTAEIAEDMHLLRRVLDEQDGIQSDVIVTLTNIIIRTLAACDELKEVA